jgi:hypothetical protein
MAKVLDEHNRLLAILGLPPVEKQLAHGEVDRSVQPGPPGETPQQAAFRVIDRMYTGEGPTAPRGKYIHWWGQFSSELPAPFTIDGGHGYLECADVEQATRLLARMRNHILAMKTESKTMALTGSQEWAGIAKDGKVWYRWMLADERQMTVELLKKCKDANMKKAPSEA